MNILLAAVYGVVAGFVTYVVLTLLATVFAPIAPFVYPTSVLVGLLVFVTTAFGGGLPTLRR